MIIAMKRTDEERRWIERHRKTSQQWSSKNKIVKVIHHRVVQQFFSYANDDADVVDTA